MKIEGIIFDWAGTTVDYGSFAPVQAFIKAFEEFGINPHHRGGACPHGHAENRPHPHYAVHGTHP